MVHNKATWREPTNLEEALNLLKQRLVELRDATLGGTWLPHSTKPQMDNFLAVLDSVGKWAYSTAPRTKEEVKEQFVVIQAASNAARTR